MSPAPKAAPSFQRRLEERNPYLFVEYWKEGEQPFKWLAEWEHLSLEVFDLRPSIKHENVSRKFSSKAEGGIRLSDDDSPVPQNIPAAQHKAYQDFVFNLFNNSFTKPDRQDTWLISGRFKTEEHRNIGFIRSGQPEEGRPTSEEGYISIYGSADIHAGYLWTYNEDEAKWDPTRKAGDVGIQLYLSQPQTEATIEEIKQAALANRQIRVTADVYVLAFQSEVERSLAEPYHHQTFWFKDGTFAPAILERLTIWPLLSPPAETPAEPPQPAIPVVSAPVAKATAAPRAAYSLKALVIALWAIAVAIVFHALR
jgi:hypothetical protein